MKPSKVTSIRWAEEQKITKEEVLDVIPARKACKMEDIGHALKALHPPRRPGARPGTWACWADTRGRRGSDNYAFVIGTINEYRDQGVVVKLPHEHAKSESRYRRCRNHEHAIKLQLKATEALLPRVKSGTRMRGVLQILNGLRTLAGED